MSESQVPNSPVDHSSTGDSSVQSSSGSRSGRLWPPPITTLIVVGMLITAAIVRGFTLTGDHAVVNILTLVCFLVAGISLGVWFWLQSGWSRRIRGGTFLAAVGGLVILATVFRLEQVDGELIPKFRLRWEKARDELLARPATAVDQPGPSAETNDFSQSSPEDSPQFRGPLRNGRFDHLDLDRDWQQRPPRPLWRQPIGAGWSSFAVVRGLAITLEQRGPEEFVTCYEVATGNLRWSYSVPTRHETILGGVGPRSTPTIADGRVYTLGASGDVLCLEVGTGKLVWRVNLLERFGVAAGTDSQGVAWGRAGSPLVVDGKVIVPAGGPAEGPRVSLVACDAATGEIVWQAGDQQVSYSSPLLVTLSGVRQVVCIHEKSVAGHDPATGQILWTWPWPGNSTADANVSQPVPVDESLLFLSKGYGRGAALIKLDRGSGDTLTASQVWEDSSLLKTKFTNVVLHEGHVYGLSDGILECAEVRTGQRRWKRGRFGHGQVIGVRDLLLVQAETGEVILVAANPQQFQELARFPALEGQTWNHPCLVGNRLLVRNGEMAACYELPVVTPTRL